MSEKLKESLFMPPDKAWRKHCKEALSHFLGAFNTFKKSLKVPDIQVANKYLFYV